jgi:2'-5' RNA ligase
MAKTLRAFIAIELPEQISREIAAIQRQLKAYDLKLRWVKAHNIHLTLKFLGDIAPASVDKIVDAILAAADHVSAFELMVQGLGVFPGIRRPKVLWTGLGGDTERLVHLQHDLEDSLAQDGFAKEKRAYKGHLTLGRFKGPVDPAELIRIMEAEGLFEPLRLPVDEIVLMQSRLKPDGAAYSPLARVSLGKMGGRTGLC